ncbi:MAG: MipA/OmpV family protein [Acidobacteriota bacterium]
MTRLDLSSLLSLLALLVVAPSVQAQVEADPFGAWYLDDAAPGWHFDLFLGAEREPTYAGSDAYETEPEVDLRAFYRTRSGQRWFASLGEVGTFQPVGDDWVIGALLELEEGRDDSDDDTLTGLDEVDSTVELQVSVARRFGKGHLGVVLQPDVLGRGKGFVTFLGGGLTHLSSSERFRTSLSLDLSWADAEHLRTEGGVTPEESARTGLPVHEPSGGLKSATADVGLEWYFAERWSLLAGLEVERYFGDAADSPLIALEGDALTTEAGVAFRFRFGNGRQRDRR